MKEFSTHLTLIPLVTLREESYLFFADRFDFSPSATESASGVIYNCDKDFVIEKPDAGICREFSKPVPCMLRFSDSKGNRITVGVVGVPATAQINPHLNTATLSIKCSMIQSPFN
jgi:hypothetical protein